MLKAKAIIPLVLMVLLVLAFYRTPSQATPLSAKQPIAGAQAAQNKFVGRWVSKITPASGETVGDGVLNIEDVSPASENRVTVLHSTRGGPFSGYPMSYPDRIEIQMTLSDGRVAHYNGVMVSAHRIEGRYFVTGNQQNQNGSTGTVSHRTRGIFDEPTDGAWTAQGPIGDMGPGLITLALICSVSKQRLDALS